MDSKIKDRHNKALERITAAIKSSAKNRSKKLQIDACPEGMDTLLRPDIILRDDKRKDLATVDMGVVFEDYKKNSLGAARLQKDEKYQSLEKQYEAQGYRRGINADCFRLSQKLWGFHVAYRGKRRLRSGG
ncbi:hypothetical protein, conserved [Eimeria praecox]|uniref:Uncharacterized protein n=1 Tax=Eimeria praecox TaxID=51316 RepID=U6H792_9EIME|nr:hypothetical protein, conserved [Eimeria praecox]